MRARGERLWKRGNGRLAESRPASAPAAETAPAKTMASTTAAGAATTAATTTSATRPAELFNAYWLKDGYWINLPPLGLPTGDATQIPTASSLVALTISGTRVVVVWVDPVLPRDVMVRTLDIAVAAEKQAWSAPIPTHLVSHQILAPVSRLFAVAIDGVPYVLWTEPTAGPLNLVGGALAGDFKLPEDRLLLPMSLGPASSGLESTNDVTVAAVEDSLVAVVLSKENTLSSLSFSGRGLPLAKSALVEVRGEHHDLQIGQNVILLLALLVGSLTLWQWRQKPMTLALPAGMIAAPLHLRAVAFLIDAAIPVAIVLACFGELNTAVPIVSSWIGSILRPDELLRSPEFLIFLGGYVLHVMIGEMFFRRSIGKTLVGLQVLMIDGKPPTLAAIVLRNLVRIPEMCGFVILFVLISDQHQRLGDLLARTLVVAAVPPEVPEEEKE